MAYAYVQDVATSWDHYACAAAGLVDPPPKGLLVHVAGPTDEGVRIIAVWESKEAWELFRSERLEPATAALGRSSGPTPTFRDLYPEHIVLRNRTASRPRGREKEEQ